MKSNLTWSWALLLCLLMAVFFMTSCKKVPFTVVDMKPIGGGLCAIKCIVPHDWVTFSQKRVIYDTCATSIPSTIKYVY